MRFSFWLVRDWQNRCLNAAVSDSETAEIGPLDRTLCKIRTQLEQPTCGCSKVARNHTYTFHTSRMYVINLVSRRFSPYRDRGDEFMTHNPIQDRIRFTCCGLYRSVNTRPWTLSLIASLLYIFIRNLVQSRCENTSLTLIELLTFQDSDCGESCVALTSRVYITLFIPEFVAIVKNLL